MILNPLCDMPWNIYLDFLADQGHDELREIDSANLLSYSTEWYVYHDNWYGNCRGLGSSTYYASYIQTYEGSGEEIHNITEEFISVGCDGYLLYDYVEMNYNNLFIGCG